MKTYRAVVTRDDDWWMIRVPAIDGVSAAVCLGDIIQIARGLIAAVLAVPARGIDVEVEIRPDNASHDGGTTEDKPRAGSEVIVDVHPVDDYVHPEEFARLLDEVITELKARSLRFETTADLRRRRAVFHIHPDQPPQVARPGAQLVRAALNAAGASQSGAEIPYAHWSARITVIDTDGHQPGPGSLFPETTAHRPAAQPGT